MDSTELLRKDEVDGDGMMDVELPSPPNDGNGRGRAHGSRRSHPRSSSSSSSSFHTALDWIQRQRVPSWLMLWGNGSSAPPLIITGVDRVLYGTQPAAEVVSIVGWHPPRYLCYMVSGSVCDVIQFGIDVILHEVLLLQDDSACWALGFGGSIVFRHTTHRYLVFGDYVGGYWASLGRMYAGYSVIIALSTLFNLIMTKHVHLPHYAAWIITLLWTGIVNYFILKKLWTFGGSSAAPKPKTDEPSEQEMEELMTQADGSKRGIAASQRRS